MKKSNSMRKEPPLGSGERFEALKQQLTGQRGVSNPGGLAAAIGRKKYGKRKMSQMSAQGHKKGGY